MSYKIEIEIPDGYFLVRETESNYGGTLRSKEVTPIVRRLTIAEAAASVRVIIIRDDDHSINVNPDYFTNEEREIVFFSAAPFTVRKTTLSENAEPSVKIIHSQRIVDGKLTPL